MDYTEKTISSKPIFQGRVIEVQVDTVTLPNGGESTRELIRHPGGVGIIAVDEQNRVPMVRQYRKAVEELMLEIPAGKLEWGEDPLACGIRELEEEAGLIAGKMTHLGEYYPTPGYCGERINIYLATDLRQSRQHLDQDEFLDVAFYDLEDLYHMVLQNQIHDMKTAIAILKTRALKKQS